LPPITGVLNIPLAVANDQGRSPSYRARTGLAPVFRLSRLISGHGELACTGTS
jgi:hypothetical protein